MRIAIISLGSRGDVQPYIALGKGLQAAGHTVRLATHDAFAALATAHGLDFWTVRGDVQAVAQSPEIRELAEKGNFIALSRRTAQEAQRAAAFWAEDCLAACTGVDLIVTGIGGVFLGVALAEKLDLPLVQSYLVPFAPTSAFPGVLLPAPVPGFLNRASHHLTRQIMWQSSRAADKTSRDALGLPPAPFLGPFGADRMQRSPVLFGYSPAVIAPPADWDARQHVTGYWFLESSEGWTPPADLTAFLEDGPPPVFVGFGSMGSRQPEATAALVLDALARTGQRGIMQAGWGGLRPADVPDGVHLVESVPHTWLFPRMAAVVHHGGAGTTAAGLRAGVPTVITPFFGDQPFWGRRVAALGVGPDPIPRKALTVEQLAEAIQQAAGDTTMQARAAALGERIRAEDGIARAVTIIERVTGAST